MIDPAHGASDLVFSDGATALCVGCILLIPLACAGLALINTGLGRSRNAAHSVLAALCAIGAGALAYCVLGYSLQGFPGPPEHHLLIGGKLWSWLGAERPLFSGLPFQGEAASLAALYGLFAASLAAMIPLSSGADRWRLAASCASAPVLRRRHVSTLRPLELGRRLARPARRQLRHGPGFARLRRRRRHPSGRRTHRTLHRLDPRPPPGQILAGRNPDGDSGDNAVLIVFGCFLGWLG